MFQCYHDLYEIVGEQAVLIRAGYATTNRFLQKDDVVPLVIKGITRRYIVERIEYALGTFETCVFLRREEV